MAARFRTKDRVLETSVTTGTGTYTRAGAATGFQTFDGGDVASGDFVPYYAEDGTNWEAGIGEVLTGPARLVRTHVLKSSNGNAAVDWGAGTRNLRCGWPAELNTPRMRSVSIAGGAGDQTLTQAEQRSDILILTGALTGNRAAVVDTAPWPWIVYNNTTGAFSATLKVTGMTGMAITQGKRRALHCDGTDVRDSANDPLASEFASGTRLLFQQTSAPTGWTKETSATYNDAALRIVTGTVGTGGADAFTTTFGAGKSTAGFTLTTAEIPSHTHGIGDGSAAAGGSTSYFANSGSAVQSVATGGGGSHSHTISSMNLKYADTIIAAKD